MRKLLITAFEPFGGERENASLLVLKELPDVVGDWEITKAILPVVFSRGAEEAIRIAQALEPEAVVLLGQAASRNQVTPELVAVNLQYARIPDNAGNTPMDLPVIPGEREAYFATLPVRAMVKAMEEAGCPAAVSYSAGPYVCNDLFYRMLHRFAGTATGVDFIHVPLAATLDPALAAKGIAAALETL